MTHRQILEAFTGLLLALLVAILSSTIVSNALPTILADLDGTQSQYTWVVTAMLLTSTATTPIWGKLSDLFSKKLLYQLAIVIFTVGSVLGGIAQSMPELIAYRALQGIGMGGLQALIQAVMAAMIAPRDRGKYSGYIGAVFAVATVSGPLLGGVIVDSALGWRWCFWVCVPIAVLAFIVLGRTLHLPVIKRDVKIDWLGATLIVGGVALLLIWISLAGKNFAWLSLETLWFVGGSVLALAFAVLVETRVREPVVPLRLFRNRSFTLAVLGTLAVGTAMFGGAVFLGQYYQIARGYSPTHAGLMTLPMVLGLFLSSTISGQVVSRIGRTKPFLVGGSLMLVAALSLLSTIDHTTDLTLMGCYLAMMGIGVGALMQNLVLVAQNTVGMRDIGSATATVTFFRTLGGSAGVSALGAVLASEVSGGNASGGGGSLDLASLPPAVREAVRAAYGDGTGTIFFIAAIVAVVTVLAVLFIKETPLRDTLDVTDGSTDNTDSTPAPAPMSPVPEAPVVRTPLELYGVVTAGGDPLPGVSLTLTDASGAQVDLQRTDAAGNYLVTAPKAGRYVLIAAAEHLQPVAQTAELTATPARHDLTLSGAGTVSGHVRGPGHRPIGGATVVLTDVRGDVLSSGLSGGDGWYQFPDVVGGSYTLAVTARGHRPLAVPVSLVDGEQFTRDAQLDPAGQVLGTIRSGISGQAVGEAQVTLLDARGQVVGVTLTDAEGTYRFGDLDVGDYTVIASGYAPATTQLTVADDGGDDRQDFELGYTTEFDRHDNRN
ncbi:MFS transporter [Prauserella cavernicola]|uniref:DHA2 family efflux MFS transporter permease subunit n=1 Tax=Prauserella cavernicola TaxID=2800127 RepID=A0A934QLL4_9PSEU|nr:MFS transporter [Prauserella cavernicola]MBK1783082.1 DHA2 family efflux MFS transporter permease subunit [Prauserella cavernicola]